MEEKVLDILVEISGEESLREHVETELYDSGMMDSIDFTDMIVQLEEELGVYIAPTEFTREEINTPEKILAIVKSKME